MAEDSAEKTLAPTLRRREEARRQGQFVRSSDLTAAAMLLGFLGMLTVVGPTLMGALSGLMKESLTGRLSMREAIDALSPCRYLLPLLGGRSISW